MVVPAWVTAPSTEAPSGTTPKPVSSLRTIASLSKEISFERETTGLISRSKRGRLRRRVLFSNGTLSSVPPTSRLTNLLVPSSRRNKEWVRECSQRSGGASMWHGSAGTGLSSPCSWSSPFPRVKEQPEGALVCRTARLVNRSPSQDFPETYDELLLQVKDSVGAALSDGLKLLEVEFPTAGLDAVPGDAEGGIEMTRSMEMIFEFSRMFTASGETKANARIFFPDANEVTRAASTVFSSSPLPLSSLTEISGFEDIGFSKGVDMTERVEADDQVFLVAYPYFNVNEMLSVEQLYDTVAGRTGTPIVVFNGELDRIRSGYYPSFFYPKLAKLAKTFLPKFEAAYYLHNFKGTRGGKLFRVYPGPWQVLRETSGVLKCIHVQSTMPTLKEVALEILAKA